MPKKVSFPPYLCPRCGYSTSNKSWMKSHLFNLRKPCPGLNNNVDLDDDMKMEILNNRIIRIPSNSEQSILDFELDTNTTTVQKTPKTSASKRQKVWNTYIGKGQGQSLCICCRSNNLDPFTFHCGHIIARANGGSDDVSNLRPICSICNLSMGKTNMRIFAKQQFNVDVY